MPREIIRYKNIFPKRSKLLLRPFFKATEMMINEELDYIPSEYFGNLLKTLAKYPEYNKITLDLIKSAKKGEMF